MKKFGSITLLPHQEDAMEFCFDHERSILGLEQGLGKTVVSGAVIASLKLEKVIVVCPASLCLNWQLELAKMGIDSRVLQKKLRQESGVSICSYAFMTTHHLSLAASLFVFDEAHKLKQSKPQREGDKWVQGTKRKRAALALLNERFSSSRVILATGTPYINSAADLIALSEITNRKSIYYKGFCEKYCLSKTSRRRGKPVVEYYGIKKTMIPELKARHFKHMIRMKKCELEDKLPPKIRQPIYHPAPSFSAETKRLMGEYNEKFVEALINGERVEDSKLASLRRELGLKVVEPGVKFIKDLLEDERPVVVFAWHRDVIDQICESLSGFGVSKIVGSTPAGKRQAEVEKFQGGENKVFVGNYQSAGVGITLTASQRVVFLECPWTGAEMEQAEDRCHRIGSEKYNNIIIYYFLFAKTLQEMVYRVASRKIGEASLVVD